jgi:hypothetical protein
MEGARDWIMAVLLHGDVACRLNGGALGLVMKLDPAHVASAALERLQRSVANAVDALDVAYAALRE